MTARTSRKRAPTLPLLAVDPLSIQEFRGGLTIVANNPPATAVLSAGDTVDSELLLGSRRLAWHKAVKGREPIQVWLVKQPLDAETIVQIQRLDTDQPPGPADLIRGYAALRRAGLQLDLIRKVAPFKKHLPDISVIAGLANALVPEVFRALERNPRLTLKHAMRLGALPVSYQRELASRLLAAKPGAAISGDLTGSGEATNASANIAKAESDLEEKLGCKVRIAGPTAQGGYTVNINWHNVDTLQGVLKLMADVPPAPQGDGDSLPRKMTLKLTGVDEFQALFGHLLPREY